MFDMNMRPNATTGSPGRVCSRCFLESVSGRLHLCCFGRRTGSSLASRCSRSARASRTPRLPTNGPRVRPALSRAPGSGISLTVHVPLVTLGRVRAGVAREAGGGSCPRRCRWPDQIAAPRAGAGLRQVGSVRRLAITDTVLCWCSVVVTNTGSVAGDDVVLAFAVPPHPGQGDRSIAAPLP